MKNLSLIYALCIILTFTACQRGEHFIKDKACREKVEARFEKQKELGKSRWNKAFSLPGEKMSLQESEALKFILAYSSLSDIADYDGKFFLENIRASFAARDTFSWGKTIPDQLFRHFVLPVRVNNENLDSSRMVFFGELKDRIKKMNMLEAALEVNHWCHEKVTYRGSDERTSSPLASVMTAYGRCGEESTFTVAALRSVCIPARQCYTPRWAHSDDNHAWVEVWINGKWHFIGACEPEAVPDAAWFTGPAKRAMLVNTNVFGDYEGPEDVLLKDERYTRINILSNYTETKRIIVLVRDSAGKPADSAMVEFQLYNYAEFYPLLSTYTDSKGLCSFRTGLGDLIIWAAKSGKYAFRKISVKSTDSIALELSSKPGGEYNMQLDLVPPPEKPVAFAIPDSMKAANSKRLDFEDKLRTAYEMTFIDSVKAYRLANTLKLNADSLWYFLRKSRGNYRAIIDFAGSAVGRGKAFLFPLLGAVSEKDLRDISFEVLMDNINSTIYNSIPGIDREIFIKYLLNPRVDNEWLKPYKSFFQSQFDNRLRASFQADPGSLAEWVKTNILIDNKANYSRAPITPIGVFELKVADPHSRDIFFVSVCRSLGIAARLEPGTRLPQYYLGNSWHDVLFDPKKTSQGERVRLILNSDTKNDRKPEYYIHYTLEKFENGFFRSLDYETDPRLASFPCELDLAPGYYLMVTGNRLKDGSVLANLNFFNLEKGKETRQDITLRKEPATAKFGTMDINALKSVLPQADQHAKEFLVLAWLEPGKEPTKHFIADLKERRKEFEKKKCWIFFLFINEKDETDFISSTSGSMPSHSCCLVPASKVIQMVSASSGGNPLSSLPVVTCISEKGEILYLSQGYRIGIGSDLLKLLP
ncbi:MAG: transglutaminase domain-containing protein [Bacteroidetes bacterium]|nr:transglutaminase domain-containing protein [Bacteroidota bacterium]